MTCTRLSDLLPLHAYGDLSPDEASAVEIHLTTCAACRAEYAAFAEVRNALDATPVPPVAVDAGRLLADVAERSARRWRRVALTAAGLAACLLVVVASRLEVRAGDNAVTLSWGSPRPTPVVVAPPAVRPDTTQIDEQLRRLDDLSRVLATEIDERDTRRVGEIAHLRARLDALQRLSAERWAESRRDFDALYTAQFKSAPKGE